MSHHVRRQTASGFAKASTPAPVILRTADPRSTGSVAEARRERAEARRRYATEHNLRLQPVRRFKAGLSIAAALAVAIGGGSTFARWAAETDLLLTGDRIPIQAGEWTVNLVPKSTITWYDTSVEVNRAYVPSGNLWHDGLSAWGNIFDDAEGISRQSNYVLCGSTGTQCSDWIAPALPLTGGHPAGNPDTEHRFVFRELHAEAANGGGYEIADVSEFAFVPGDQLTAVIALDIDWDESQIQLIGEHLDLEFSAIDASGAVVEFENVTWDPAVGTSGKITPVDTRWGDVISLSYYTSGADGWNEGFEALEWEPYLAANEIALVIDYALDEFGNVYDGSNWGTTTEDIELSKYHYCLAAGQIVIEGVPADSVEEIETGSIPVPKEPDQECLDILAKYPESGTSDPITLGELRIENLKVTYVQVRNGADAFCPTGDVDPVDGRPDADCDGISNDREQKLIESGANPTQSTPNMQIAINTNLGGLSFDLPISGQSEDLLVDWGGGSTPSNNLSHTYGKAGRYVVTVIGTFTDLKTDSITHLTNAATDILYWHEDTGTTNLENAFSNGTWSNLKYIANIPSSVTDMSYMFQNNPNIKVDIAGWNTSNVTNMKGMFQGATGFNQEISCWNTSAVTDMSYMFADASRFNQDLAWDTGAVTNMEYMFADGDYYRSRFNGQLGSAAKCPGQGTWSTANVTNMAGMFMNAVVFTGNGSNLDSWDTAKVTDMSEMFRWAFAFNQDISGWSVASEPNTNLMFEEARSISPSLHDALIAKFGAASELPAANYEHR